MVTNSTSDQSSYTEPKPKSQRPNDQAEAVTSDPAQGPALALLALVLGALRTTHGFRKVRFWAFVVL